MHRFLLGLSDGSNLRKKYKKNKSEKLAEWIMYRAFSRGGVSGFSVIAHTALLEDVYNELNLSTFKIGRKSFDGVVNSRLLEKSGIESWDDDSAEKVLHLLESIEDVIVEMAHETVDI